MPLVAVVALVLLQLPVALVLAVPGGARYVLGPACLKIPHCGCQPLLVARVILVLELDARRRSGKGVGRGVKLNAVLVVGMGVRLDVGLVMGCR